MLPAHGKQKISPLQNATANKKLGNDVGEPLAQEIKPYRQQVTARSDDTVRDAFSFTPSTLSGGAYNSNLVQLQIDELLSNVQPDYEVRLVKAENVLRKLKSIIECIPPREPRTVCNYHRPRSLLR